MFCGQAGKMQIMTLIDISNRIVDTRRNQFYNPLVSLHTGSAYSMFISRLAPHEALPTLRFKYKAE